MLHALMFLFFSSCVSEYIHPPSACLFKAPLQPVLLPVFCLMFFLKQRMGVWLIVRRNSSTVATRLHRFSSQFRWVYCLVRPQMRPELSQHTDSLSLDLFFTVSSWRGGRLAAAAPRSRTAACRPQRTGGRIDMLPWSALFELQFGDVLEVHRPPAPADVASAPSTDTAPGCTVIPLVLLTGLFSCFLLLGWKLCAPRRPGPLRVPQTSKMVSAAFS